jgi:hypothetical protein
VSTQCVQKLSKKMMNILARDQFMHNYTYAHCKDSIITRMPKICKHSRAKRSSVLSQKIGQRRVKMTTLIITETLTPQRENI